MTGSGYGAGGSRAIAAALGLALLFGRPATATSAGEAARAFLASAFTLGADEFERARAGEVVTRTLAVTDPREVATFGIVRMKLTPDFYVSRLIDIVNFKRADAVLQIGAFGTPPAAADVATLTLDAADIRSLRECRVGRCGVQLSAPAIDRFQRDVPWQRPDAAANANALMRQIVVDYVARYQQTGVRSAMRYADQSVALDVGQEFVSLAASDLGGWEHFPDLRRHVLHYPDAPAPDTRDLLYWSKERVGRRSVVSVTHVAIARTAGSPAAYAIASKQIYGTHYYDASLGLTVLLEDRSSAEAVTYVAYLNRSRIDMFEGVFGKLTRKIVTLKARSTVSDQLAQLQRTLESQFASRQLTQ